MKSDKKIKSIANDYYKNHGRIMVYLGKNANNIDWINDGKIPIYIMHDLNMKYQHGFVIDTRTQQLEILKTEDDDKDSIDNKLRWIVKSLSQYGIHRKDEALKVWLGVLENYLNENGNISSKIQGLPVKEFKLKRKIKTRNGDIELKSGNKITLRKQIRYVGSFEEIMNGTARKEYYVTYYEKIITEKKGVVFKRISKLEEEDFIKGYSIHAKSYTIPIRHSKRTSQKEKIIRDVNVKEMRSDNVPVKAILELTGLSRRGYEKAFVGNESVMQSIKYEAKKISEINKINGKREQLELLEFVEKNKELFERSNAKLKSNQKY